MINFEFTKTDDRKNKVYKKNALASVFMEPIPKEISNPTNRSFAVVDHFKQRLVFLLNQDATVELKVSVTEGYKTGADWQVYIIVQFKAGKPSQIVSDEVAKAAYPDDETINNRIDEARTDTIDALKAHEKHCKDAHGAGYAMDWQRNQLVEQTKNNTRFDQRLAALVAEYDAEYLALCADKELLPNLLKDMSDANDNHEDEDDKWSPQSFALVREHLAKYLADHKPEALPMRLPSRTEGCTEWMLEILDKEEGSD
jgi:hypothetical protein